GGVPLGTVLAREELTEVMTPGTHASTFGGNPLATTAASAVLDLLQDGLLEQIARVGAHLDTRLSALSEHSARAQGERGLGLWRAVILGEDVAPKVVAKAHELGLL